MRHPDPVLSIAGKPLELYTSGGGGGGGGGGTPIYK